MAFKLDPIFNRHQSEAVRYEIDLNFGSSEIEDLIYCNGSKENYMELADRVPYLCGSFTGWRYQKMHSLEQFCRQHDMDLKTPLEQAI